MKFVLAILAVFVAICLVPDGRSAADDSYTETLYTSHPCETSRWYFTTSDADSVTVTCYKPDPPQAPDSE